MAHYCSTCGGSIISTKRRLQAWAVMAFLASPSKAFLPAPSSSFVRRVRAASTAAPTSSLSQINTAVHRSCNALQATARASNPRQALLSLSATDGAKDAAMAAVQAAEETLNRTAEDAGAAGATGEVQATVAAARAAARSAMESLRIDRGGLGEGAGDAQDVFNLREDVTSPARSAVESALLAIAEAETAAPATAASTAASTAARDAVGMVQAALGRRDSAAAEVVLPADDLPLAVAAGQPPADSGIAAQNEDEMTREPESARTTRDNPAASHSHMSHLLWRQIAGPGDTVLDCTAGNGYDTLELAKIVALSDGVGKLYAMDVQERALEATRARLDSELGEMALKRSTLLKGNFRQLPAELQPMSVQLIVYNLGWLPGGDKTITTELEDTLESIESAKRLVKSGGMISVMLYKGHAEGKREAEALLEYAAGLTHFQWRVFVHERINRPASPSLLTIYKL